MAAAAESGFNEAATIQSRKFATCNSFCQYFFCFNEAATIQSRKFREREDGVGGGRGFNEAATIQSRKCAGVRTQDGQVRLLQ